MSGPDWKFPEKLAFLFDPARYKVAYGGRGGAKSWGFARALLVEGYRRPLRILCTREIMDSIADSVHKLLSDQITAMGLDGFYTVQDRVIYGRNGTEFAFAGLRKQDVHKIKSFEGVDIVWVEEAQAVSERSWSILTPTIRKPGSEIWVSFNPEMDTDPTYQRFVVSPPEGAVVVKINWDDNPWFPAELERERLDLQRRDPESYDNVWLGQCRKSVEGAVYAREIDEMYAQGRFANVPYDPVLRVHTIWDLGWADSMSIIFAQRSASEMRVIDYIEDSYKRLDEYVAMLKERGYNYGTDFIPHDGSSRDIKTGQSTEEVLRKMGRNVRVIPRGSVEEGIKAARRMFPRTYFDKTRTAVLVNHLKRYRRHIPTTTGAPGNPVHDEHSHGADAFRELGVIADQLTNQDEALPSADAFRPVPIWR